MVTFILDFCRSMLMESTKLLTVAREDQRCSVVYIDVGPLSSRVIDFCLVLLLEKDSYLLFLRVLRWAVSCFLEMGGNWKRYLDDVCNQLVEVM